MPKSRETEVQKHENGLTHCLQHQAQMVHTMEEAEKSQKDEAKWMKLIVWLKWKDKDVLEKPSKRLLKKKLQRE
ncbi:unnamed protein product [Leptidea sinapis]|uniref:Uncharacterized protein n=1 Tax=Leptidea sinapis TaxID=189913 RepID=A0A5E4QHT9_9NEOP|nr:unnamed protein product [Leptidea sinapis]